MGLADHFALAEIKQAYRIFPWLPLDALDLINQLWNSAWYKIECRREAIERIMLNRIVHGAIAALKCKYSIFEFTNQSFLVPFANFFGGIDCLLYFLKQPGQLHLISIKNPLDFACENICDILLKLRKEFLRRKRLHALELKCHAVSD